MNATVHAFNPEILAANVMAPPGIWKMLGDPREIHDPKIDSYVNELTAIAFDEYLDRQKFRAFVNKYKGFFQDTYCLVASMSDNNIDYVLDRVREERISVIEEYDD